MNTSYGEANVQQLTVTLMSSDPTLLTNVQGKRQFKLSRRRVIQYPPVCALILSRSSGKGKLSITSPKYTKTWGYAKAPSICSLGVNRVS